MWKENFLLFFVKTVIEEYFLRRISCNKKSNCLIQTLELTRFGIIWLPDHFHLVLVPVVRENVLRSIRGLYCLANDEKFTVKYFFILFDGKRGLISIYISEYFLENLPFSLNSLTFLHQSSQKFLQTFFPETSSEPNSFSNVTATIFVLPFLSFLVVALVIDKIFAFLKPEEPRKTVQTFFHL